MTLEDVAVDALATYRLTRLALVDEIAAPARDAAIRWSYERAGRAGEARRALATQRPRWSAFARADEHPPPLAKLLTCWWCASVWAAVVVVCSPRWLRRTLAASAAAVIVHEAEDHLAG